jgi:uncharacterized cupredoxin-like copper-binding protein
VTLHNFAIDELGIDVDIAPGETQEAVVNAQAGTYEFYCNVPGHKEAGMVGTLTVVEGAAQEAATEETAAPAAEATPAETAGAAPAAQTSAQAVEITADDIFFAPTEVSIPANSDVPLTVTNDGVALHNFSIDELGIDVDIAPGESQEVFVNAEPGTYEFYCNVPGHKDAGMTGALIVGDAAAPAAVDQTAATPAGAPAAATPVADAEAPAAAAESVEVVSHDIFFEPTEVTIPADTDVTFSLPNDGVTLHNFAIDELGIDIDIAPGETQEAVINAPAGTYEYYCNVPGHKEAGMLGTLTVE